MGDVSFGGVLGALVFGFGAGIGWALAGGLIALLKGSRP